MPRTKPVVVNQVLSYPDIKLKGIVRINFSDDGVLCMSKKHYDAIVKAQ
jgi:hypothetical protein